MIDLHTLKESIEPFDAMVRIKEGARIGQDHHFAHWPECCPPTCEYIDGENPYRAKDPNMLFHGFWSGSLWNCTANGYGNINHNGDYGSGSIFVFSFYGVDIIEDRDFTGKY